MTDDVRTLLVEFPDEPDDVSDEDRHPVIGDARRFLALRIAAKVGCDHPEAVGERRNLLAPGVRALRKPVKQEDERALAFDDAAEADAVNGDPAIHSNMLARAMPCARGMSSDLAFSVGLLAGWLALVVWLTWPDPHCKCCPEGQRAHQTRDRKA